MNARLEAKEGMYRTVEQWYADNSTEITATSIAILNTYGTDLSADITVIEDLADQTVISTKPITAVKKEARFAMIGSAAPIAGAMYAYAIDTANTELEEQMKPLKVPSYLKSLKDEIIVPIVNQIHSTALALVTVTPPAVNPLTNYGVASADVTALGALITAYEDIIATPEAAIEARKALNIELKDAFTATDELLKRIDAIMELNKLPYPSLYLSYKAARVIFDPVTKHTGFRGTIIDAITLMPIQGVKVTAVPSNVAPPGENGIPVSTLTDENGYYTLATPQYKNNPYTVIWTKTGYAEQQATDQYVKRGKKNTINISLETITP